MSLRLLTAAVVAMFFGLAGLVLGQPRDTNPATDNPAVGDPGRSEAFDRIRERERTGADPNVATGTFGTTNRGTASGAADSPPAEQGRRSPAPETMSEPTGPASAERRPGTAVTQ